MKKLAITSLIATTALFAATNEEILSLYSGMPSDIKTEISKRETLKEAPEFDMVIIKMSKGEVTQEEIFFTKGDFILPDVMNIKTGDSYKSKYQQVILEKSMALAYKKEKAENIIKLGNDPKKSTIVIFTDANCPYCRKEMSRIDETLKTKNVEIIMTAVGGPQSDAKSFKIYEETKAAKTDADKLAVIKKYYDPNTAAPQVSPEGIQKMKDISSKYFNAGLRGVPFVVEKDKLK